MARAVFKVFLVLAIATVALPGTANDRKPARARGDQVLKSTEIYDLISPSVVIIRTEGARPGQRSQGTGFIVAGNLVLSNRHIVAGKEKVFIEIPAGGPAEVPTRSVSTDRPPQFIRPIDRVLASHPSDDLVLLEVSGLPPAPTLKLSPVTPRIGRKVYIISNIFGFERSIQESIIAGHRVINEQELLQLDGAFGPGSSGGIVVDEDGLLVGMTVARYSKSSAIGFAAPIDRLRKFLVTTTCRASGSKKIKIDSVAC